MSAKLRAWRTLRELGPMTSRQLRENYGVRATDLHAQGSVERSERWSGTDGYTYTATDLPPIRSGPLDLLLWLRSWGATSTQGYSEDTGVDVRTARNRANYLVRSGLVERRKEDREHMLIALDCPRMRDGPLTLRSGLRPVGRTMRGVAPVACCGGGPLGATRET